MSRWAAVVGAVNFCEHPGGPCGVVAVVVDVGAVVGGVSGSRCDSS